MKKKIVTLPAVKVEIPRMGMVVYVSPRVGVQDNKWTCMFTAEVPVKNGGVDVVEIQSFHIKCKNSTEANKTIKEMSTRLKKVGPYPFIQTKL